MQLGVETTIKEHHMQDILSPIQLATIFGVDRQTIYRWRREGRLPDGFLISRSNRRWTKRDLEDFSPELKLVFGSNNKTRRD